MYALNFYSKVVAEQLRTQRKTATIRLGDKSGKYKKGMIVAVLTGNRYSQRQQRQNRSSHPARLFLFFLRHQPGIYRDERRRKYAFAKKILQDVGNAQRAAQRIRGE